MKHSTKGCFLLGWNMKDRILIEKDKIPYRFVMDLERQQFTFKVKYNKIADIFTLSLYKENKLICADEPIMYNHPLFKDVYRNGDFPIITIIPIDEAGQFDIVTWDNFNEEVFLSIENGK